MLAVEISFIDECSLQGSEGWPGSYRGLPRAFDPSYPLTQPDKSALRSLFPLGPGIISPSLFKTGLAHYEWGKSLSCPRTAAGVKLMCQLPFGPEKGRCLSPIVFFPSIPYVFLSLCVCVFSIASSAVSCWELPFFCSF